MSTPDFQPDDPFLHAQLRDLPAPRAPQALMDSVLSRLRTRTETVWWRRPILQWPQAARFSGVAALLALAVGLFLLSSWLAPQLSPEALGLNANSEGAGKSPHLLQILWYSVSAILTAIQASLSAVPIHVWWILGTAAGVAYLGCLCIGAWAYRQFFARS